jgi:hypothetical protein
MKRRTELQDRLRHAATYLDEAARSLPAEPGDREELQVYLLIEARRAVEAALRLIEEENDV